MTSHEFGLLQTAAFRALKGRTNFLLKKYELTSYEWALLGVLFENDATSNATFLAKKLRVSKPFTTKTVRSLHEKGWLDTSQKNESDSRSINISLTKKATDKIPEIETYLKTEIRPVFKGVNKLQMLAYVLVLRHIVKKLGNEIDNTLPPTN